METPNTTSDVREDSPAIGYALFVIHILLAVFLLFCNTLTVAAVCLTPDLRTLTNMFVANLAIADLLMGLATIIQCFLFLPETRKFYDENIYVCILFYYVAPFTSAFESQFCLLLIAFDRLVYVVYPLRHVVYLTNRSVSVSIVCSWLAAFALGGIPVYWNSYSGDADSKCVSEDVMNTTYYWKILPWTMLSAILVAIVCYVKIIIIAKRQRRRSKVEAQAYLAAGRLAESNASLAIAGLHSANPQTESNGLHIDGKRSGHPQNQVTLTNVSKIETEDEGIQHMSKKSISKSMDLSFPHETCRLEPSQRGKRASCPTSENEVNNMGALVQAQNRRYTQQSFGSTLSVTDRPLDPQRKRCFGSSSSDLDRPGGRHGSPSSSWWELDHISHRSRSRSRDSQLDVAGGGHNHHRRSHGRRSVYVFFTLNVLFAVCWIPYLTVILLGKTVDVGYAARAFLFFIASCNSGVNFVIYAWKTKEFRRAYKRLVVSHCSNVLVCEVFESTSSVYAWKNKEFQRACKRRVVCPDSTMTLLLLTAYESTCFFLSCYVIFVIYPWKSKEFRKDRLCASVILRV
ncbi:hypothetical protein BaRGS_00037586, partial [Batillaria attramentaria]